MNVYMLKTTFLPAASDTSMPIERHIEHAFRTALRGTDTVNEFSRVSAPDSDTGLMAVVCSEEAARFLRARSEELGLESLTYDEGRTARRHAAYPEGRRSIAALRR